ncbi:MAG: cysteine-rich CWC family protein [Planctomycetes bacterium]|nr:cysteine-rich CWC family protein [Planctomycetota bacterium]
MVPFDSRRCPACGAPNSCAMATAAGAADATAPCWCRDVSIDPRTLAALPAAARGVACLCRACATGRMPAARDNDGDVRCNAPMPCLPPGVTLTKDPGGRDALQLTGAAGTVLVAMCGAQVLSWRVASGDVLWTASRGEFAAGKAVRGGIPLVFPWLGNHPHDRTLPAHGVVRTLDWRFVRAAATPEVVLETNDTEHTRRLWPHAFHCELTVRVADGLDLTWTTTNTDDVPLRFEEALHSYFAVGDVLTASVHGLEGVACTETASEPEPAWDPHAPLRFRAETDRIFHGVGDHLELDAPALSRRVQLHTTHAHSTIVWNPWPAKGDRMTQMAPGDWRRFCCVETANVREHAVTLGPGERHTLRLVLRCD